MGASPSGSLRLRVLSAAVGLPLLLLAVWVGGTVLFVLTSLVALAALWEFRRLAAPSGPLATLFAGPAILLLLEEAWLGTAAESLGPILAGLFLGSLAFYLLWAALRPPQGNLLAGWALSVTAVLYIGGLLSYGFRLRGLEQGFSWLLLSLLVTFASDTGAYFMGRALGRHKMAPRLSPGKTWEGALGGLVAAGAACALLVYLFALGPPPLVGAGLGIILSVAAQLGDLAESFIKRAAGAKEAGGLIPGHGGVLDRLDSLLFVFPVLYYAVAWGVV
ncbi:MAG: phosphatidate cytidylyltransferase [Chloroflexi bacterium]|nr:phosphatidate cytidylyltransferase [Chloroflexota bacterium]